MTEGRNSLETMSGIDTAQLQIERLQTTLNRVYRNVTFYKRALDASRVSIESVRSLRDMLRLPFTTKEDLQTSYPYDMFALPLRDVVRIHASQASAGKPIVVGYSRNDIVQWSSLVARQLSWAGVTEHDVVQIAFSYSLFTGGLGFHFGAEQLGASVIPASTHGNLADQVMIMKDFKTTVLICAPSTSLALARAMTSMGIHPEQLHLRLGIFGSEPWSEGLRKEIENTFHITAFDAYGASEVMGPGISAECEKRNGLHINEDHFIVEVINPQTLEHVPPGDEGELVFTTITKEAFPLIRYRTGDLARLLPGACSCGRTFVRMSRVAGRTDDLIVLQGAKVFPAQVFETVLGVPGIAPMCRIVLDTKDNADTMEINVSVTETCEFVDNFKALEQLRCEVAGKLESNLGIKSAVKFMEHGRLQQEARGKKQPIVIDKRNVQ